MENKNHTLSCYRYCIRVYELIQKISEIKDGRTNPEVKLPEILLTIIFSLMAGLHSFNTIKEAIEDGDFDKFFNNIRLPSDDTIRYALMMIGLKGLRKFAANIVQKSTL